MITEKQYKILDDAMKYFNDKLFEGKLPDVLLTLQRKSRTYGYHCFQKFEGREDKAKITEIALNPDGFDRTDEEVFSTLAHELVHHWQYTFSEPARRGYHDKIWAAKMCEIGLLPTSTGEVGGKQTGQRVTHIIMDGGAFEIACKAFLLKNKEGLLVNSIIEPKVEKERKKTRSKFCCPVCLQAAWARKTAKLACGVCLVSMIEEE